MFFKAYRIRRITKKIAQLQQYRLNQAVKDEMIVKEVKCYHKLNKLYTKLYGHKKFPFALEMATECLRLAAQLDDVNAEYALGERYLEEGKWRESLERGKYFASQTNLSLMKIAYEHAHAYLTAAENKGCSRAKRLHGLSYINAWGVSADKNKGFKMVVESIADENAWDKAPQILALIGLNKPEFYEAMVKQRGQQG